MASAFLHRTMDRTADSGYCKKWVFSVWVKRAGLALNQGFFSIQKGSTSNSRVNVGSGTGNSIWVETKDSTGNTDAFKETASKLRDVNGWYHIYIKYDSTESTASDRLRFYINGVEPSYTNVDEVGSNFSILMNSSVDFRVGIYRTNGGDIRYWDGQMAHLHFINYEDGATPDPYTDFGETDSTTGIWKPKTSPSVTYGDQSVFLKFDNSANMGLDSSGQGNNLTTSGTIIQTKDSPSNVFAKINLLDNYYNGQASGSLSVINTKIQTAGSGTETYTLSTLGASKGKYYCEMKLVSSTAAHQTRFGIAYAPSNGTADWLGKRAVGWSLRQDGTPTNNNSTISGTFASYTAGDIISMAVDLDNSKLYFRKNNDAWMNSGDPTSGSTGTGAISITAGETYLIGIGDETGGYSVCELNFGDGYFGTTAVASAENPDDGNGIFEYDVPAGYRALCTKSINAEEYS